MTRKTPASKARCGALPFPWRCPRCLKKEVCPRARSYTSKVGYDGRVYEVTVPRLKVPCCRACGEMVFSVVEDAEISAALRKKLRLLTPAQIRAARIQLKLHQRELAVRLGVAEATVSRWESDRLIQSRAMDNLLRLFFGLKQVRSVLSGKRQNPRFGTLVNAMSRAGS